MAPALQGRPVIRHWKTAPRPERLRALADFVPGGQARAGAALIHLIENAPGEVDRGFQ